MKENRKNDALLVQLSNQLNMLMANERLTASELGRRVALPASTIKKIRNCDTPNPTVSTLLPIAHYFALTLSQMVGDENLPYYAAHASLQKVPVISWADALEYPRLDFEVKDTICMDPPEGAGVYALPVEEINLENLPAGTMLIVNPELAPQHLDLVIIHKIGQPQATIRQWIDNQNEIYLKTLMAGCPFAPLTEDYRVLGVVTEHRHRLRPLPPKPVLEKKQKKEKKLKESVDIKN